MFQIQDITREVRSQRNSARWLLRALWAAILTLELYWLLWDIPLFSPPPLPRSLRSQVSLGQMIRTEKEVRIQNAQDTLWDRAHSPSVVYSGSRIMTLAASSAEIELRNHGTLTLQENTLVSLEEIDVDADLETGKLKLLRGDAEFRLPAGARPLQVELASGKSVQLAPGAHVRTTPQRLEVLEGSIQEIGSGTQFTSGQSVEIIPSEAGHAELRPLPLVSPVSEIAPTPEASPSVAALAPEPPPPTPSPLTPRKALPPPPKMKAPQIRMRSGQSSSTRKPSWFLCWLIPEAHADEVEAAYGPLEIDLRWEEVPGAHLYRIEIARDRSFRRILVRKDLLDPTYTWNYRPGMENTRGRVFYRVASIDKRGEAGEFSTPEILNIPRSLKPRVMTAEKKPAPLPSPSPLPSPAAVAAPPAPLRTVSATATARERRHSVSAGLAFTRLEQSTQVRALQEVTEPSPHLQETFSYSYHSRSGLRGSASLSLIQWKSDSATHSTQPSLSEVRGRIVVDHPIRRRNRSLTLGGLLDRSGRFVKDSRSTVKVESAFSAGGVIGLGLVQERMDLIIALPLSGLFMDSYWGAEVRLQKEVEFGRFFLTPYGTYSLLRWDTPADTEVRTWSLATSLGYRF